MAQSLVPLFHYVHSKTLITMVFLCDNCLRWRPMLGTPTFWSRCVSLILHPQCPQQPSVTPRALQIFASSLLCRQNQAEGATSTRQDMRSWPGNTFPWAGNIFPWAAVSRTVPTLYVTAVLVKAAGWNQ